MEILKSNNYQYHIADNNLLDYIIDDFFENHINTKKLKKYYRKTIHNQKELLTIKLLIKTFINLFKSNNHPTSFYKTILRKIKFTLNIKEYLNNKRILLFIINIYLYYENELQKNSLIDFNDMINKCTVSIKEHGLKQKWKYIIIDEYQDTSLSKFNMINEILEVTKSKLLVVGDDFQSIYRFTGCNLDVFLNFNKYYKDAEIMPIINTYRNPQELIDIAGNFIMKNKKQMKKDLHSNKHIKVPLYISLNNNKKQALKRVLSIIESKDIFVIGRNNNDIKMYIDNEYQRKDDYYTYQNKTFRYLTIHKSKGLESEVVIIINALDDILGLPSQIKSDKILKYVNNTKDYYPYEEERRLFYVALTRTKSKVYIISSKDNPSIFVKELLKDNHNITIL